MTNNVDERYRNERFYLEDLYPGQRFTSGAHMIYEAQIRTFAREFDPQPFNFDEEAAKGTLFAGLAASGWHTAAITMRLLTVTHKDQVHEDVLDFSKEKDHECLSARAVASGDSKARVGFT